MDREEPVPYADPTASVAPDSVAADLPIAFSDLLQLLANDRTRALLYYLTTRGGTVFLDELAAALDGDDILTALHHVQLPRLVDFHIIDYDEAAGAVTLTSIGDELRPALEAIEALETAPPA
ncbi:hypothetical protein [Natronolimnohabitans innermongolicus]|uniref:ArsR family transcriptional regulator n=1 Tax=Natronolimnohabitans innermongolicus JCM 12255 TaxID=1227499 RepID=L9XKD6_9EURY|nr:hypothetical protein [Natronolimnohabitans innermongolicus]ELY61093.1 hypothetical protein C493_03205 [Natronolimnohabitans innermongolicus JCM 12255]